MAAPRADPPAAAVSPDRRLIAAPCGGEALCLWDAATGARRARAEVGGRVTALAFSPDGKTLAAALQDATVALRDGVTLGLRFVLRGHLNTAYALAFSPDSSLLASGGNDDQVRLWSVATGKELRLLVGHTESVNALVFFPDGKRLASGGSFDETVRIWSLDGDAYSVLRGSVDVDALALTADGRTLAVAGSVDDAVQIWDVPAATVTATLTGHGGVRHLALLSDGKTLAAEARDNEVRFWNLESAALERRLCLPVGLASLSDGAPGAAPRLLEAGRAAAPLSGACGGRRPKYYISPPALEAALPKSQRRKRVNVPLRPGLGPELWLGRAEALLESGDEAEAGKALAKAAALEPSYAQSRRLAAGYARLNDPRRALEALAPYADHQPQEADYWIERAESAAKTGDRALALEALTRARALNPAPALLRRAAGTYAALEEYRPAAELHAELAKRDPLDAAQLLEQARIAAKLGERAAALEALAAARKLTLDASQLRRAIAQYRGLEEYGAALQAAAALTAAAPEDAAAWLDRADLAARSGDQAQAREALGRARALKPSSEPLRRLAEAIGRNLEKPEVAQPLRAASPLDEAEAALNAGARQRAREALAKARAQALDPDASRRLARLYARADDHAAAAALLLTLSEKAPRDASLRLDYAAEALACGERDAALAALSRARALELSAADLHRAALLHQDAKDFPQALALLDELARRTPTDAAVARDRGVCLYLSGRREEAIVALRAALVLDGQALEAYATLGSIYAALDRYPEALEVYERALALPADADASDLRAAMVKSRDEVRSTLRAGTRR